MNTKALKSATLAIMALLIALPAFSQKGIEDGSKYGKGQDSINCIRNLSLYKEFFKHNNYKDAIGPWRVVFGECPASSENMYIHGTTMYKKFLADAAPERQNDMVDTIMIIYDRRIEYFPQKKGSILGRKGVDLLRYRRNDIDAMELANSTLKECIEIEKTRVKDVVLINYVNSSIALNQAGRKDDGQSIEDYFMVTEIIDKNLKKSSRWPKTKASVDELMLNSGLLTCDALNSYFEPQFEASKEDKVFLEKVIKFYSASGCDRSDLYVAASEQMYVLEPGPKSAHQLSRLLMSKNDFEKAEVYLQEAVLGEDIDNKTKAEWYYELALVSRYNKKACEAIKHARQAVALDGSHGKAYIVMGDAIIDARTTLGDDFSQRTAFWVAADKYTKAKSVDPEVSDDASKKLRDYAGQYPNHEDAFFRDLKDGDSYQVKGCINEYTTVRTRK